MKSWILVWSFEIHQNQFQITSYTLGSQMVTILMVFWCRKCNFSSYDFWNFIFLLRICGFDIALWWLKSRWTIVSLSRVLYARQARCLAYYLRSYLCLAYFYLAYPQEGSREGGAGRVRKLDLSRVFSEIPILSRVMLSRVFPRGRGNYALNWYP